MNDKKDVMTYIIFKLNQLCDDINETFELNSIEFKLYHDLKSAILFYERVSDATNNMENGYEYHQTKAIYQSTDSHIKPLAGEIVIVRIKNNLDIDLAIYTGEKFFHKITMQDMTPLVHSWAKLP